MEKKNQISFQDSFSQGAEDSSLFEVRQPQLLMVFHVVRGCCAHCKYRLYFTDKEQEARRLLAFSLVMF